MSGHLPSIQPPRPQLAYSSSPNYDSSSAPSTISPQTPSSAGGGMALLGPQIGRPDIDGRHPYPAPVQLSPLDSGPRFSRDYEQMTMPPNLQETFSMNRGMAGSPIAPPPLQGGPLQAHKRAYRQRRKDPSCDACRERKVKCDATDTSSCSECAGRNVKCQFTKETNRRMSSIKQVQDLEKQLLLARQQVSQLRSIVKNDTIAVDDDDVAGSQGPNKRRKLNNASNAVSIQKNMESCGKGLIKPPSVKEQSDTTPMPGSRVPDLPSKERGQHLLNSYRTMLHSAFPFLNWPAVERHFDNLYNGADIRDVSADASAVLFGVFACGALRDGADNGKEYFEGAKSLLQFWTEKPSLDLIRAALLTLIYLVETNHRTTGFALMGFVVRAAQDIGLHHKTSMRSAAEEELRFKLWWSIFCTERYLSFEVGRPTMINDEDCEPPPDERPPANLPTSPMDSNQFDFMVKVARTIPHIQKAFKTPVIPPGILSAIDEQINNCNSMFPPHHQIQSTEYLDPGPSSPVVYLQNARLLLHRHNLSPASPPDAKGVAIERCMAVARDTARMFTRVMRESPHSTNPLIKWEDSLRLASSAFLCLHIWRCTMFLAGSGDFDGALKCAQSSAAIGKHRPINSSCGRYLEFFLQIVSEKFQQGRVHFGDDDELLTYVSADLQSNLDQAWIWQNGGKHSPLATDDSMRNGILHSEDARDWNGWNGILSTLQRLSDERRHREQQQHHHHHHHQQHQQQQHPPSGPINLSQQQHLSPSKEGSGGPFLAPRIDTAVSPLPSISPGASSNRMSIADLI